jgi:hypothetical protein
MRSKTGLFLAGAYLLIVVYFVATRGLLDESFVALILGIPWTLLLALIEFGGAQGATVQALLLATMALNAFILYCAGVFLDNIRRR